MKGRIKLVNDNQGNKIETWIRQSSYQVPLFTSYLVFVLKAIEVISHNATQQLMSRKNVSTNVAVFY